MAEISFEQFGRKLNNAADQVKTSEAKIVLAGSSSLASDVARSYRAATGGDGKLSGTSGARRKSGKAAAVSARAKDVRRYSDGNYVGLVVPTGPYGLIEADIAPHVIAPFAYSTRGRDRIVKKARRAANRADSSAVLAARIARAGLEARTANALRVPGSRSGYLAAVNHPGTRGRPVFSRAVAAGGGKVTERMMAETTKQMLVGYKARG